MNKKIVILLLSASCNSFSSNLPDINSRGLIYIDKEDKSYFMHEEPSHDAGFTKFMLNIKQETKKDLAKKSFMYDPHDTTIKKSLSQIRLAFKFNGLPLDKDKIVGYAPGGSNETNAWTGVSAFFIDENMGACKYAYHNILYAEIVKSDIKPVINGHSTVSTITGNDTEGYLYSVNWLKEKEDKTVADQTIECASYTHDNEILKNIVEFAKKVDKFN